MRKFAVAVGVAALLCAGNMALAEPAQVDYESMTLEEVKALAAISQVALGFIAFAIGTYENPRYFSTTI